ncbi:MAG: hypothetical protein ABSF80_01580 [Chitinispirillaceae bacterium]|jgi:hypothetical protein
MRQIKSIFVLALVFIAAGTALTLENIGVVRGASKLWPGFVLILGAGFLILFFDRRKNDLALLFLGTIISLLGVFFFFLNYTAWSKMATLWPVFLGIAGAGFLAMYLVSRARLFLFLFVALTMLAGVFYLVFGISLILWPLSLVAFGASLLVVNHFYLRK